MTLSDLKISFTLLPEKIRRNSEIASNRRRIFLVHWYSRDDKSKYLSSQRRPIFPSKYLLGPRNKLFFLFSKNEVDLRNRRPELIF